ncbi:MAG TPA: RecX family transcriptional regulator [Fimbriimonadaceae bacterium]|nr:RecX family transcriptional regulator [Fimbriimonadaceae bacterium]HRJ95166.1 RecX family transcriptional regulator [Fimbriimonadaceae bacterium]
MKREEDSGYAKALLVALRSIRQADRLRAEVEQRLLARGFAPDTVVAVLAQLGVWGFLDDGRTVDERVTQMRRRRMGRARIAAALVERGASEDQVAARLASVSEQDEIQAALELLDRRRGDDAAKAGRFLAGRGFEEDTVREVLARKFPDEEVA